MEENTKDNSLSTEKPQANGVSILAAPCPPAPIPDGGLMAWLQVLGAAFLFFNSW